MNLNAKLYVNTELFQHNEKIYNDLMTTNMFHNCLWFFKRIQMNFLNKSGFSVYVDFYLY